MRKPISPSHIFVALVVALGMLISACSRVEDSNVTAQDQSSQPESNQMSDPESEANTFDVVKTFESLDELREAYIAVGGLCDDWKLRPSRQRSRAFGECSESTVLSHFSNELAVSQNLIGISALGIATKETFGTSFSGSRLVVGPNWIINEGSASTRNKVIESLGGQVIDTSDSSTIYDLYLKVAEASNNGGLTELIPWCSVTPVDTRGNSVSFDTEGKRDFGGDTVLDVYCALAALQAPRYVFDVIKTTRALDGRQSETWQNFRATWTYHPDDGLQIVIIFDP